MTYYEDPRLYAVLTVLLLLAVSFAQSTVESLMFACMSASTAWYGGKCHRWHRSIR